MSIVFFDIETSALPDQSNDAQQALHRLARMLDAEYLDSTDSLADVLRDYYASRKLAQVIQIAAVVVDDQWHELESFEVKMQFDRRLASEDSLALNSYTAAVWAAHAVPQFEGLTQFRMLLRRHQTLRLISKAGRPYMTAQLAGHNITAFDIPMITAANLAITPLGQRPTYMHHSWQGIDTLAQATWMRIFTQGFNPDNLQLPTLSKYFGVPHEDAHDALGDVRANVLVARAMLEALGLDNPVVAP